MLKISLIIPAYNEEKTIDVTLKSLKEQTYTNFEMIVINNNSTDNTATIAKKYSQKVILETKQGYHHAVNRGVKEAKAEIFAVCDSDCVYPSDWLSKIVKHFENNSQIVGVYGNARVQDANFLINWLSPIAFFAIIRFSNLFGFHNPGGFNFAIRKSTYIDVGGYDPKIYDGVALDAELGRRIQTKGVVYFDPSIIVTTSSRRFRKAGFLKTSYMFLDAWVRINFRMKSKFNYEQYNQTYRD